MKIPHKIKSGTKLNNTRQLSDIFYFTLLTLDAILKRCSFKDAKLYLDHNDNERFDFELIGSAIMFNLFSEYGVGKILEPLIEDLLKERELKFDKYADNIFNKEIIRLVPETLPLVREANSKKETSWCYNYALSSINIVDGDMENERNERLDKLLTRKMIKYNKCHCNYCIEFRKYNQKRTKHIDSIIIDVILEINNSINF